MRVKRFLASGILATSLSLSAVTNTFAAESDLKLRPLPLAGEIVSLDDSSVTIAVKADKHRIAKVLEKARFSAGEEVKVNVSSDTQIIEGKEKVDLSAYEVGQTIFVLGKIDGDTVDAKVIADHLPKHFMAHRLKFNGEVAGVDTSTNTITVKDKEGTERSIGYSDETKFVVDGEVASENDLETGAIIKVKGRFDKSLQRVIAQVIKTK